jgi:hypothetical protein
MFKEFPPPPRAAEFSELIKKRLAEAQSSGGTRETVTVDWNGKALHVEVVELPLSGLYYNPGTHRIRAQRTHDAERDEGLTKDPWTAESQDYLGFLLQAEPANPNRRDPDFEKLKDDLKEFGQNEPGLVTHQGVLVNGNTRAAALREIGQQTMRVGVLPESFTWADVTAVELALQLRTDRRREYSYINRLLAMEEQASLGLSPEAIARAFRIKVATYHQERWILATIRELIERSRGAGTALRLIDFEDDQEKLKELHRLYQKLQGTDRDLAETIKELRLAAILMGFSKTDVRLIDEEFVKRDYLPGHLTEGSAPAAPATVSVPGLGEVTVPAVSSAAAAARALNDKILRSKAVRQQSEPGFPEADQRDAQAVFDETRKGFEEALDIAGRNARIRKRKQMAPHRLLDACTVIEQCTVDLVQARATRSLDEEEFDEAVLRLRETLRKLAQQAGRGLPAPGDGVSWLIEATAPEGA